MLVREKLPGVDTPVTDAVTEYPPAVQFAMTVGDVASPELLVVTVVTPPAKLALGPLAGALKTTVTPARGFPFASLTTATRGEVNDVLTVVACGDPLAAVIEPAAALMLFKEKLAGIGSPSTEAVTV